MKYYFVVGEASGDLHASRLMSSLKQLDPQAEFRFYGGDKMQSVGGTLVEHYSHLAYMGFIPVLTHLGTILRGLRRCKEDIVAWRPDVVVLVDYPGFNLKLAKYLHAHTSIPVHYYISPKIWAWKEWRIKAIRRDISQMYCILPFEVDFYRGHGYDVHYVGNPTMEEVKTFETIKNKELGISNGSRVAHSSLLTPHSSSQAIIAILPGSRRQEIRDNLGRMLLGLQPFVGDYALKIAAAPGIEDSYYRRYIPAGCEAEIVRDGTYPLLHRATAGCVVSGTATLEATLFGLPHVVCYATPVPRLIAWLRKRILKVPFISLENLIAGREVSRELVADTFTVEQITDGMRRLLPGGGAREATLADYAKVRQKLDTGSAPDNTAKIMIKTIQK